MGRITRVAVIVGIAFLTSACASSEDWKVWLGHNTHFASDDHWRFSMKNNKDGSNPHVTRSDIENSRRDNWWGIYAVSVSPNQIIQG